MIRCSLIMLSEFQMPTAIMLMQWKFNSKLISKPFLKAYPTWWISLELFCQLRYSPILLLFNKKPTKIGLHFLIQLVLSLCRGGREGGILGTLELQIILPTNQQPIIYGCSKTYSAYSIIHFVLSVLSFEH